MGKRLTELSIVRHVVYREEEDEGYVVTYGLEGHDCSIRVSRFGILITGSWTLCTPNDVRYFFEYFHIARGQYFYIYNHKGLRFLIDDTRARDEPLV